MKVKFSKQILIQSISLSQASDGIESHLLDFPSLDVNDAILTKRVTLALENMTCPPAFNGQVATCYPGLFNWGLDSNCLETNGFTGDLLESRTLLTYSAHCSDQGFSTLAATAIKMSLSRGLGGPKDQIDLTDKTAYGNLNQFAARCLYATFEKQQLVSGGGVMLRVDYDVVTLSSSEQAESYRLSSVC